MTTIVDHAIEDALLQYPDPEDVAEWTVHFQDGENRIGSITHLGGSCYRLDRESGNPIYFDAAAVLWLIPTLPDE